MPNDDRKPPPWRLLAAEFAGTALLVGVGLSFVILNFSPDSPVLGIIPGAGLRRAITGFLFGTTGATIALSALGRTSGAHINPAVTLAFWTMGRMRNGVALGYVLAQVAGGIAGGLPLLFWGDIGAAADYGVSVPGQGIGWLAALGAETATTFLMVALLLAIVTRKRIRKFTPALFPVFYALAVFLEAPVSGTSTNPARSVPPEILAGVWSAWWIYWVGPLAGAALAALAHRFHLLGRVELEIAKIYHFDDDLGAELSHWRGRG